MPAESILRNSLLNPRIPTVPRDRQSSLSLTSGSLRSSICSIAIVGVIMRHSFEGALREREGTGLGKRER